MGALLRKTEKNPQTFRQSRIYNFNNNLFKSGNVRNELFRQQKALNLNDALITLLIKTVRSIPWKSIVKSNNNSIRRHEPWLVTQRLSRE